MLLRNFLIKGDLILAAGIRDGDIRIEDILVKGKIIINGGSEGDILFKSCELGDMFIYKRDGEIRIISDDSSIKRIILDSGGLIKGDFNDSDVEILGRDSEVKLEGDFNNIIIEREITMFISERAEINKIIIEKSAEKSIVNIKNGVYIKEIVFNGKANVSGGGNIENAIINVDYAKIEQRVKNKMVKRGIESSGVKEKNLLEGGALVVQINQ